MSFESFLEKITTFNTIDNVLVCEASFTGLRAAALNKKGDRLTVTHEALSKQVVLDDAVTEVVEQVRQKGWKGEHAILVSPAVCMTVLDLAIPPNNKLPVTQIAETMQWEIEPAFNQHQRAMMLGQLLQFHEHLSHEELETILQQQAELANAKGNAAVYKAVGELAKEMFGVQQADLANCINQQKWFINEADGVKCGWHALKQQPMAAENLYKWVVSGMNQALLREWQAALAKHEVALEACYPLVGGGVTEKASTAEPQKTTEGDALLFELHQGVIAGVALAQGEPQQIQSRPCQQETLLNAASELYQALNGEQADTVALMDSLSKNQADAATVENDLNTIVGGEVIVKQNPSKKVSVAIRNAVYHFLGVGQPSFVSPVSAHAALPPVLQRLEVRAVLAVMGLLAVMVLTEAGFFARELYIGVKKENIAEDVGNIRSTIKRIQDEKKAVDTLKTEIEKQEAERKQAETIVQLVSKELPERNAHLMQLLTALEHTVTEDIVVEKIVEDTIMGFKMHAWSISEQAAQEFIKFFQIEIHPMAYRVKDLTVTEETGRLGLIGYSVNFTITQLDDEDWLMRKRLGNRPLPPGQYQSKR